MIAKLTGKTEEEVKAQRLQYGITAAYKMVDTCAAEFEATTPYYYSVYGGENEAVSGHKKKKVLVLGSGPSGSARESNSISAPCTVPGHFQKKVTKPLSSTTIRRLSARLRYADKLYFEPLTPEDVENVVNVEKPDGAVVQFGGQTPSS